MTVATGANQVRWVADDRTFPTDRYQVTSTPAKLGARASAQPLERVERSWRLYREAERPDMVLHGYYPPLVALAATRPAATELERPALWRGGAYSARRPTVRWARHAVEAKICRQRRRARRRTRRAQRRIDRAARRTVKTEFDAACGCRR